MKRRIFVPAKLYKELERKAESKNLTVEAYIVNLVEKVDRLNAAYDYPVVTLR